jgi:hypothetical protein
MRRASVFTRIHAPGVCVCVCVNIGIDSVYVLGNMSRVCLYVLACAYLRMYVCMYVHICPACVYVYTHMLCHTFECMYACICCAISLRVYVCMHMTCHEFALVCIHAYAPCVCVCVHMLCHTFVCMYACMHVCMHMPWQEHQDDLVHRGPPACAHPCTHTNMSYRDFGRR